VDLTSPSKTAYSGSGPRPVVVRGASASTGRPTCTSLSAYSPTGSSAPRGPPTGSPPPVDTSSPTPTGGWATALTPSPVVSAGVVVTYGAVTSFIGIGAPVCPGTGAVKLIRTSSHVRSPAMTPRGATDRATSSGSTPSSSPAVNAWRAAVTMRPISLQPM